MKKVEIVGFVKTWYEEAETQIHTGSKHEMKPFLDRGYTAIQEDDGILLVKPAMIHVKVLTDKVMSFNVTKQVLNLYGEKKVSKELFQMFEEDAKNKKVQFQFSDSHHLTLVAE